MLLSIPFLVFGLLWAIHPPLQDRIDRDILVLLQTLGVAMALLSMAAIGLGVYLIRKDRERIL